jgi:hypothetical protein
MDEEIFGAGDRATSDNERETIAWSPRGNPAQQALVQCPIFEVFFGGARGGGKTDGMLGEWVKHADRYGKDVIGLMLRRTRTELIETIERSRAIYGLMGWTYNETDKMWRATNTLPDAHELVELPVDMIVAGGEAAIRAARRATSQLPIVMTLAADLSYSSVVIEN